jgi:5-formyltetrahydrofolate cyclo-ligase
LTEGGYFTDIAGKKQKIRQQMKQSRLGLSSSEISKQSQAIQKIVTESEQFKKAKSIGAYFPANNEVLTNIIIDEAIRRGKVIALPRVNGKTIRFFKFNDPSELRAGAFGIPEPELSAKALVDPEVVLVPGLAFDKSGYRIGYGKGYYDRFLKSFEGISLGIAYPFQILANLPHNKSDVGLNFLATIGGVFSCSPRSED